MNFDFVDDEALRNYYRRIVAEMTSRCGISEEEAFLRVAHFAKAREAASNPSYSYLILHRSVQYWAEGIYEVAQSAPLLAAGMNGLEEGTDSMSVSSSEVLEVGGGSMPPSTSCRGR